MVIAADAGDKAVSSPSLSVLSKVASAELPGKAAALVAKADARNQKQTTVDVVKTAIGLNPAAAPLVVGSIAQASPEMAAIASATAAYLVTNQVLLIAKAAAAAAPAKAGEIVEALCHVLPANYQEIANAVAEVVPGAGKDILAGIAMAIPELKNAIYQTLANYGGRIPSVNLVLTQVSQIQNSKIQATLASGLPASLPARGPSQGGPFIPLSGTPTQTTPSSGGVTPNPVNYSAP